MIRREQLIEQQSKYHKRFLKQRLLYVQTLDKSRHKKERITAKCKKFHDPFVTYPESK